MRGIGSCMQHDRVGLELRVDLVEAQRAAVGVPVERVERPGHDLQPVARRDRVRLRLADVAVGRPPQRRRRAAEVRERLDRALDLDLDLCLRQLQVRVVVGPAVRLHLVARLERAGDQLAVPARLDAEHEERRADPALAQQVEDPRRVLRIRPVVERQRDARPSPLRRAPGSCARSRARPAPPARGSRARAARRRTAARRTRRSRRRRPAACAGTGPPSAAPG